MPDKPGVYRIMVKGRLDEDWSDRLAGMRIRTSQIENEITVTEWNWSAGYGTKLSWPGC